jgi:BirA family biotin operon repressor/biotin-[acetyl-CoA-carboxylase] ligase
MDALHPSDLALPGVHVRVVERCASTNTELMREDDLRTPALLAAELQTAGRGRRGRRWHGAPGRSLTFSLAARVARPARELAALPLVAGVAAALALRALGAAAVGLKWPNDLVVARSADGAQVDAKLGGILVETRGGGAAPLAVIGIGINYRADDVLQRRVRRAVASLDALLHPLPGRGAVIAAIGAELLRALARFEHAGLAALRDQWLALDAHAGRRLRVRLADGRTVSGLAAGLAEDGGLQLRTRGGLRAIRSGRVVTSRLAA